MKSLYDKYLTKIVNSVLSEQDIISLRSQLNGRRSGKITNEQREDLISAIEDHKPRVSEEQSRKGIDWLRKQWHTPTGKVRKNNPFGDYEQYVLDNFGHFEFVGLYDTATSVAVNYFGLHSYLPIYRVLSKTEGHWFDYVAAAWQSGQSLRILS